MSADLSKGWHIRACDRRRLTYDEGGVEHTPPDRYTRPVDQPFTDDVAENAAGAAMAGSDSDSGEHGSVGAHVVVVLVGFSAMLHAMAIVFMRHVNTLVTSVRFCDRLIPVRVLFAAYVSFAVIHPMIRV